ncbi:MAG: PQQ-binding-like beta-propeller repeat protein [Eubacterium sp.]|nr:PQQ-binding-like beta-propeller repeat protein [Eubacterium sp.]
MNKKTILMILIPIIIIAAAVIIFFCVRGSSTGGYSGTVTAMGEPLANVSVSDGRNVVKTDENGEFTLKGYKKTRFITVTAPAGYTTENYYIPADKNKSDGYDFNLEKSDIAAGEAHSFLQISDTEIGENGVGEWINYLKDIAENEKPAFLIHTGDICYEPGLKKHIEDMNTENMGIPVRYIIGNHDYVDGKYGEELFESLYGPVWYSFEVGNVHYVVTPFQTGGDRKSGYNKNDRWRWLENDLANTDENMKVVMFNHNIPPTDDYVISFDRKELDLKKHNLIAWVFGHYHYNYIEENEGVLNISTARPDCGGIDSSVSGARMIHIAQDGSITTNMTYYDFNGTVSDVENGKWTAQLDGNILFCNTVVDDNKVYVATVNEDYPRTCGIYCLNPMDGSVLWNFATKNSVKNNLIIENGLLIAQDCEGNVYCLDSQNGTKKWSTTVELANSLGTSVGICASDDVVYTGCAAAITALDINSGEKKWENIRNHGEGSPAEFVVAGDKLLVSSHWDALIALDKNTGKELWKNKDEDIRFRSSTPAIVDDNTLIVADSDAVMIVDANTGEITTKKDFEGYNFSSSAQSTVIGDIAYIPTANKGLITFNIKNCEIVQEIQIGKAMIYTAPYTSGDSQTIEPSLLQLSDGSLAFGASDGKLYIISADGAIEKTINIGAPIFGSAAYYNGSIIVSDFTGRVICLNEFE